MLLIKWPYSSASDKIEDGHLVRVYTPAMFLFTKDYETFEIQTAEGQPIKQFVGAAKAGKALVGDLVQETETGCKLSIRGNHPPLSGILELASKIRYGFTSRNVSLYLFKPYNESYPPFLVAYKETMSKNERVNQLVVVAFEHWDSGTFPRGGLVQILGPAGNKEAEKAALAIQYSPWTWTKKRGPDLLILPSKNGRFILDKPTINIDPPGCQDIDDVISLWEEGGQWNLAISISDVAAYVELNPALQFAESIGQTLYSPEGKVLRPMFPTRYSENLFSLLPGEDRLVLTLFAKWNGTVVSDLIWKECVVRNWASYTYENCHLSDEISMGVLRSIVGSLGCHTTDTHKWVESLMLLYNSEAAVLLKKAGAGLLRVHSAPDVKTLDTIEALGLPAKELAYPAAVYASTDISEGHWGLQKSLYCHASSPIRRYADIVNQGVIKAFLKGLAPSTALDKQYAVELNRIDKSIKGYERDCRFVDCLLESPGVPLHGIVVSVGEKITVYCFDWKRMIRCKSTATSSTAPYSIGDKVLIGFFVNSTSASWKKRVVYRLELATA